MTAIVPLPVVVIEIVEVVPALLTPELAIVIPPPAFVRVITPKPSSEPTDETLLNVTVPPPDWSKVIRAPLGSVFPAEVREVTVTAEAVVLLRSILPSVESAAIEAAAKLRAVVLPMPVDAASVMVGVVIKPAPLMLPAVLRTETVPVVVVIVLPIVTPADPFSETVPDDVVKVPLVARVPKRDWKSILPALVLRLKAEKLRVVPAIAVMPVLAPRVGLASVSAFASVMETVAPVEFSVTAPVKSLPTLASVITPAPALNEEVPAAVMAPVCVTPTAVTVKVPLPKVEAPKSIVFASVIATLFTPELFKLAAPVKSLLV